MCGRSTTSSKKKKSTAKTRHQKNSLPQAENTIKKKAMSTNVQPVAKAVSETTTSNSTNTRTTSSSSDVSTANSVVSMPSSKKLARMASTSSDESSKGHSTDTKEHASVVETESTRSMPDLKDGTIVCKRWKIIGHLGSGGCGVVYKVERIRSDLDTEETLDCPVGTKAAMKAELISRRYDETLKAEAAVLRRMAWSVHFCRLYMAGSINEELNIVIMSLVGKSLSYLRKNCTGQRFTLSTATRLAIQCFDAIAELHSAGFLHRDIKASNFATGAFLENRRIVYLIDFGFARSYLSFTNSNLQHRRPRSKAPFMGTDRYCSVNVHCRIEQSRRDDLWSYLYMVIEMMTGSLPWRKAPNTELPLMKVRCLKGLLAKCPRNLRKIQAHIEELKYDSTPDYKYMRDALYEIFKRHNYTWRSCYDWESGGEHHPNFATANEISSVDSPSTESSQPTESLSGTTRSYGDEDESALTPTTEADETTRWDTSWEDLTDGLDITNTTDSEGTASEVESESPIKMVTTKIKNLFVCDKK